MPTPTNPEWIAGSLGTSQPSGTSSALFSVLLQLGDNSSAANGVVEMNLNSGSATGQFQWGTNAGGFVDTRGTYTNGVPVVLEITDIRQAGSTATLTVGVSPNPTTVIQWPLSNALNQYSQIANIAFGALVTLPSSPVIGSGTGVQIQWLGLTVTTFDSSNNATDSPAGGALPTANCPNALVGTAPTLKAKAKGGMHPFSQIGQHYEVITQDTTNGTVPVRVKIQGNLLLLSNDTYYNNSSAYTPPGHIASAGMKAMIWVWGA